MAECRSQKQSDAQPSAARWAFCDYYFMALGVLLAGYAIGSKAFAYISIPPLYIGDVVFAFGIIAFLKSRCAVASLATLPSFLLGILIGWAITRLLPYLGEFGMEALRDSVIVVYSGFAFIVAALLLERPERLLLIIPFLRVVGSFVILTAPIVQGLHFVMGSSVDEGHVANLTRFTPPDVAASHLAGAALLMLLGFRRAGIGWILLMLIGMALVSMQSRGSVWAIVIPIIFAAIAGGKLRKLAVVIVPTLGLLGLAYALDLSYPLDWRRSVSAQQLVDNVASTFGASDVGGDLHNTRDWRLRWWNTILNYTFEGPYFWTGKGFGVNLALDDGFPEGTRRSNRAAQSEFAQLPFGHPCSNRCSRFRALVPHLWYLERHAPS